MELKDKIRLCEDKLCKLGDFSEIDEIHWIGIPYGDCMNYCYECCKKAVDRINITPIAIKGDSEHAIVDGGWSGAGCDGYHESSQHCDGYPEGSCGTRLDTSLSESGVMEECNHFLACDFHEIDNDDAIDLYNLFEAAAYPDFDIDDQILLEKLADQVLYILGETVKVRTELLDI